MISERRSILERKWQCSQLMANAIPVIMVVTGATLASAQSVPPGDLATIVDHNIVDLSSGSVRLSDQGLEIGTIESGGLQFQRKWLGNNWTHEFNISVINTGTPAGGSGGLSQIGVSLGSNARLFSLKNGNYVAEIEDGSTITETANGYIFIDSDGTTINFKKKPVSEFGYHGSAAVGEKIIRPNGETIDLYYRTEPNLRRLQSVVSSRGYHLKFRYYRDAAQNSWDLDWLRLSQVKAVNSAIDYCDPTALSCDSTTKDWPQIAFETSISTVGETYKSTGPSGILREYKAIYAGISHMPAMKEVRMGSSEIGLELDNHAIGEFVTDTVQSVAAEGGVWTYSWGQSTAGFEGVRTSPQGLQKRTLSNWPYRHILSDTDELNRTKSYEYDQHRRLIKIKFPEGNEKIFIRDSRGNINEERDVSKVGGHYQAVIQRGYSTQCFVRSWCNKPIWIRDAKNHQTDYNYDSGHGGVLSEMMPAPYPGGARPLKLTAYVQRYSWTKGPSGILIQGSNPTWLVSSVTECQTAHASNVPLCDSAAPQTLLTMEYGADGTSESALVKGIVVSSGAEGLRSCFGYDFLHRRVSETKPRSDLSTCP